MLVSAWSLLENGFPFFMAALMAAAGLVLLSAGMYMLCRAPVRHSTMQEVRWRWRLNAAVDDATLRAALRVLARIRAWSLVFSGAGVMLVSAAWLSIAWFSAGNFLLIGVFNGWGPLLSVFMAIGILGCVGHAYGVQRMRARARNHPALADLRPRRVRDYVPTWVSICVAVWLLMLVTQTVVALLVAKAPLRIQLGLDPDRWVYLPFGRWGLLVIPLLAVLCMALGLGLLRWMVALPRLKSLDKIPDVGVFDMHFRRDSILFVLREYTALMFAFFVIQWMLATYNVSAMSVPAPIYIILFCALLVNVLIHLGMIIGLTVEWSGGGVAGPLHRGNAPV